MKPIIALTGGLAGALALTALHQLMKNNYEKPVPRMDLLGMEGLSKLANEFGISEPAKNKLYDITLAGDIISNAIYYSGAGAGKSSPLLKGTVLGLLAGAGAVYLPQPMGLNPEHTNKTPETRILAVLYYLTGGIVAGGVMKLLSPKKKIKL